MNVYLKTCTRCGESKPRTTEFFNLLSGGTWRGSCKKCMAANSRKHHAENPEMTAARRTSYNQRLKNAEGFHNQLDLNQLRETQKDRCNYCGDELNGGGELDHKIPLLKGGTNWVTNLAWTCRTCNRDKGSKTASEFLAWRQSLGLEVRRKIVFVKRKI